jgi:hypothetical protein
MNRRSPGRATRQILSGSQLSPPRDTIAGRSSGDETVSLVFWYLVALAVLVILSAIVWAIWGMSAASPIVLVLAIALVGSWLVL